MTRDSGLLASVMAPGRDPDEVLQVLAREYGHGRDDGDGSITLSAGDGPELLIRFGKRGPMAVSPLSAFDRARFERAAALLAEVLDAPISTTVCATVLFASRPVDNAYRDPEQQFQILPVPGNAPRPPESWARHPFLFEFAVRRSSDGALTTWRAVRALAEWTWFLNAVLRDTITGQSTSGAKHWVLWPTDMTPPIEDGIHWVQEFYSFEGMNARPGEFSEPDAPAMSLAPLGEYYAGRSVVVGTSLELPKSIAALSGRFEFAGADVRRRFLRAARWIYAADRSGSVHFGSSHVALVTAIETLVENELPDVCSSCGQDKYSATARFRDFPEAHRTRSRLEDDCGLLPGPLQARSWSRGT
jgi:hypothetical protein